MHGFAGLVERGLLEPENWRSPYVFSGHFDALLVKLAVAERRVEAAPRDQRPGDQGVGVTPEAMRAVYAASETLQDLAPQADVTSLAPAVPQDDIEPSAPAPEAESELLPSSVVGRNGKRIRVRPPDRVAILRDDTSEVERFGWLVAIERRLDQGLFAIAVEDDLGELHRLTNQQARWNKTPRGRTRPQPLAEREAP